MKKQLTIIGPAYGVLTGQSSVTIKVYEILSTLFERVQIVNNNFEGMHQATKILYSLFAFAKSLYYLKNTDIFYISIKRGNLSLILDYLIIALIKLRKKKVIIHLHGNEFFDPNNPAPSISNSLIKKIFCNSDQIICLNSYQKSNLIKIGHQSKTRIMPNYFDISNQMYSQSLIKPNQKNTQIIFLSNFIKEKGFLKFLHLPELFSHLEFHLCGRILDKNGVESAALDEILKKKLPNFVYHGFVGPEKKEKLLTNSGFIFFPSTYATEAQPLSVIEAMSFGCIPIVANRPYISDIVNSNNGIILSDNPTLIEIENVIKQLLDFDIESKQKACIEVSKNFTLQSFSKNLKELINDAI